MESRRSFKIAKKVEEELAKVNDIKVKIHGKILIIPMMSLAGSLDSKVNQECLGVPF